MLIPALWKRGCYENVIEPGRSGATMLYELGTHVGRVVKVTVMASKRGYLRKLGRREGRQQYPWMGMHMMCVKFN